MALEQRDVVAVSERRFEPLPRGVSGCLCSAGDVPAGLGEFVVVGDGDGGLLILRCDPRVAISGMLLRDWHGGTPGYMSLECHGNPGHAGDVIRVEAEARRVVYVITRAVDCANDVWEARWPD